MTAPSTPGRTVGSTAMWAAGDWETAVIEAEQRQQWPQADQARLRWASCLHRQGCCDAAPAVLRQAWDKDRIGERVGLVMAAILCIRLLRRCHREDEAGELWVAIPNRHDQTDARNGTQTSFEPSTERTT